MIQCLNSRPSKEVEYAEAGTASISEKSISAIGKDFPATIRSIAYWKGCIRIV